MFAGLRDALVSYIRSQAIVGGLCEGIVSVKPGPINPLNVDDAEMPCVTVSFAGGDIETPDNQRLETNHSIMLVELYTTSLDDVGAAEAQALRLFWSDNCQKGLLLALAENQGYDADNNPNGPGAIFRLSKFHVGYRQSGAGYTYMIQIPLTVKTMQAFV